MAATPNPRRCPHYIGSIPSSGGEECSESMETHPNAWSCPHCLELPPTGIVGGLPERRVFPILNAARTHLYKKALKLSLSIVTEYPNSPCAHALKASILEKMGKPEEALSTCLKAKDLLHRTDDFIMDSLTLTTMQLVFMKLDRVDLASRSYEIACARFPTHLQCLMCLYNCYAREFCYEKQQQTALKLYRIVGGELFLFATVCSIQMQVFQGHGGDTLLVLAEELLEKHIASHGLQERDALMMYLSVLEQQGKYWKAMDIITGKLGSLFTIEVDRLLLLGRILALAGDHSTAATTFKKVLESCPDDWQCFLRYLACLFKDDPSWCNGLIDGPVHPPKVVEVCSDVTVDMLDSRMLDANKFVNKLQAEPSGDPTKGPYLANLEIERRKYLHKKVDKKKLIDLLVQYFYRFGHLSCFCSDVEVFVEVLDPEERTSFLEELLKDASSLSVEPIRSFGYSMTLQKIKELIIENHYKLSNMELQQSVMKMLDMYDKNLHLSKDLDQQEKVHGEELLSMASHMLVQLYWRTMHLGYLLEAVMVLELGLTIRNVWNYKILLVHLYCHLGALPAAYVWYKTLNLKSIPMESMTHHILPQLLASPLWADLDVILKDYIKFMKDLFQELPDLIFGAYSRKNYSKVIELSQFKEKLEHSDQYLMARIEASLLRLKKAHNVEEEESSLESFSHGITALEVASDSACSSLTFNEDLRTRPWWTPTPDKNYLLGPYKKLPWFTQEKLRESSKVWEINVKKTIKKRSFLPRMIYLSLQSASSASKKENTGALSLELKSLLEQYACTLGVNLNEAIEILTEVCEGQISLEAFGSDTLDWVNLAVFVNALTLHCNEHGLPLKDKSQPASNLANTVLEASILDKVDSSLGGGLPNPMLVQLISEPLAWHIFIIQSCARSCLGKKKRKGTEQAKSLYNSVQDSIRTVRRVLEAVIKQIKRTEEELDLDKLFSALNQGEESAGPGLVFGFLCSIASQVDEVEVGDRIAQAMKSWDPVEVARKAVSGQKRNVSNLLQICSDKLKSLEALKFPV